MGLTRMHNDRVPGIARTSARETHAAETTKISHPVSGLPGDKGGLGGSADPFDPPLATGLSGIPSKCCGGLTVTFFCTHLGPLQLTCIPNRLLLTFWKHCHCLFACSV